MQVSFSSGMQVVLVTSRQACLSKGLHLCRTTVTQLLRGVTLGMSTHDLTFLSASKSRYSKQSASAVTSMVVSQTSSSMSSQLTSCLAAQSFSADQPELKHCKQNSPKKSCFQRSCFSFKIALKSSYSALLVL